MDRFLRGVARLVRAQATPAQLTAEAISPYYSIGFRKLRIAYRWIAVSPPSTRNPGCPRPCGLTPGSIVRASHANP
jgi:hypothetical protein